MKRYLITSLLGLIGATLGIMIGMYVENIKLNKSEARQSFSIFLLFLTIYIIYSTLKLFLLSYIFYSSLKSKYAPPYLKI